MSSGAKVDQTKVRQILAQINEFDRIMCKNASCFCKPLINLFMFVSHLLR